jgi:copper chaperone CopZ
MKQLIISVPNMQSTHCQTKVNNAVQEIKGVQINNITAGYLTISFTSERQEEEVLDAIEKAGYTASAERDNNAPGITRGCCNR